MDTYIGNMYVLGEFIKKHYDTLYTKNELKKLDDEEVYEVEYYEVSTEVKFPPWYSTVHFKIPDINDKMKTFTFNTSSVYALELCGYDFNEITDNEDESC